MKMKMIAIGLIAGISLLGCENPTGPIPDEPEEVVVTNVEILHDDRDGDNPIVVDTHVFEYTVKITWSDSTTTTEDHVYIFAEDELGEDIAIRHSKGNIDAEITVKTTVTVHAWRTAMLVGTWENGHTYIFNTDTTGEIINGESSTPLTWSINEDNDLIITIEGGGSSSPTSFTVTDTTLILNGNSFTRVGSVAY